MTTRPASRLVWPPIIERAAEIVREYDTAVTLRQVFYRLIAVGLLPNLEFGYKGLSMRSAQARRDGWFPALADLGRSVARLYSYGSPEQARAELREDYRRDRTEGQPYAIYLGLEKGTLTAQVRSWFDDRGLPVVALRGYSSQTLADDVREEVEADGRPAVLLYAGDFDPSGDDLLRDFIARTGCWKKVVRVALTDEQVRQYDLPTAPGKLSDSRSAGFEARHGRLVQVEVEALDPAVLRSLYQEAVAQWWDEGAYRAVLRREEQERRRL